MIRKATLLDVHIIAKMANIMWTGHTEEELADGFKETIGNSNSSVFLYYLGEEPDPIGFAQCQLRHDYVEGTDSSPVGYLEGIFVEKGHRQKGYAKELLGACEVWAKEKGCSEFASDCELTNDTSYQFHLKMGFLEANRIICFTKNL